MQKCVALALRSRMMKVLVALVILSAAAGFTLAKQAACQHSIHCPCGSTNKSVTVCMREETNDDSCSKWSKCKTCQDGLNKCLECPEGLEGPLCTTATRRKTLYRQKRQFHFHSHYDLHPRRPNSPYQASPNQADTYPTSRVQRERAPRMTFCQDPGVDQNGSRNPQSPLSRQGFPQGSLLEYSCNPGYDLDGQRNVLCLISGEWSSDIPRCNSQSRGPAPGRNLNFCSDPDVDLNGSRNPLSPSSYLGFPQGTRLHYSCNRGYDLQGESSIFCLTSGEWSSGIPKCNSRPSESDHVSLTFCRDPGVDPNGNRTPRSQPNRRGFPQGTLLEYSCNQDYVLDGEKSIFCLASGEWSSERARCRAQPPESNLERMAYLGYCDNPGPILNGKVTEVRRSKTRFLNEQRSMQLVLDDNTKEVVAYPQGSQLKYSCNNRFSLQGETNLTCEASGRWSADLPTCITSDVGSIMYCINPGPILNGRIRNYPPSVKARTASTNLVSEDTPEFPEGTRLEYDCDDGYLEDGTSSLTCQSSGIWTALPPKCVSDCGRAVLKDYRITHRTKTMVGEWPWVVAITARGNYRNFILCGGAVLNSQMVITAAHCLLKAKQFILYFGKYYYGNDLDDSHVLVRTSDKVIIHPNFEDASLDSDIALIKFKPRIKFSERIQPICLPTGESTARNIVAGRKGYVTGWGHTERNLPSVQMKMVYLPIQPKENCLKGFPQVARNLTKALLTQNKFCVGSEDARQFICIGDDGSPIVFYDAMKERYILEGLVSFGTAGNCGIPGRYTVFTSINPFLPWIFRNM